MYCGNCGNELDDDAAFCTRCGEKAPDIAADETVVITPAAAASATDETVVIETAEPPEQPAWQPAVIQQTKQMPVTPAPAPAPAAAPAGGGPKKKRTALVIAVACLVVVALVAVGFTVFALLKKHEDTHVPTQVQFDFTYTGDQGAQPIGVPIVIQGADLDGKAVDEQLLATPSDNTIELLAGSYTISLAGNPVSNDGTVYAAQNGDSQQLEIPIPDSTSPQAPTSVSFSFEAIAPDKIPDQQVETIRTWMTSFGVNTDEVQRICNVIVEKRNAEAARIALEQEKQTALAANPRTVVGPNPSTHASGEMVRLTGTVRVGYFDTNTGPGGKGNVCYLELPDAITVTGTQYGNTSNNKIILGDNFTSYRDKVVTISASLSVRMTASIKEAACSHIWANNTQLIREF